MTQASASPMALYASRCIVIVDRSAAILAERTIREFEPYLERAAAHIADHYPAAAEDMVQEARIRLWELDLGRFSQRDAGYLKRILCNRMIDVFQTECRDGLTRGSSKQLS
jgi:DNA-directed RNA polymerase specialized sigma24 family protein